MKKLLFVSLAMVFVFAMFVPQATAEENLKLDICHVTDAVVVNPAGVSLVVGHVINVSEKAKPAHLRHGDILAINDIDDPGPFNPDQSWRDIADIFELSTSGANCAGFLLP